MSKWKLKRDSGQKGFTLIEMSIVLVIIGLIIGGILKGQEIIANARAKAVVNQINAVRAAHNTYVDRFRAFPGDDSTANARVDARVANGNGNGVVGAAVATPALIGTTAKNAGENYQYFNGLVAANLINGAEVTAAATATVFGAASALPASPIGGAGLGLINGTHTGDGTNAATSRTAHWAVVHITPGTPAVAVSPRDMQAIDNQTDDGLSNSGGVRGHQAATCNATAVAAGYAIGDTATCFGIFEISQ